MTDGTAGNGGPNADAAFTAPDSFDPWHHVDGVAAFIGGTANVIMQLSRPAVGYGVVESSVDSGNVTLHPFKRLRTTLSYLSVALAGTDEERTRYRHAVNQSHRLVRSGPDSPVTYNALDPALQLWVAACLYWGYVDLQERLHGPMDEATANAMYEHCGRFATTLQVRPDMWPVDRNAFDDYWQRHLATVSIDSTVRAYLNTVVDLRMLPWPLRKLCARPHRFLVTGLLPQHVRDEMRLTWTLEAERRLTTLLKAIGLVYRRLPRIVRRFPMNYYLWNLRIRMRYDRRLV